MATSTGIDRRAVDGLWEAAAFARDMGTPLNLLAVVAWQTARTPGTVQMAQTRLLNKPRKWLSRRGIPIKYAWVIENTWQHGLHANIWFHVPLGETTRLFRAKLPDWVRQCGADILRGGTAKTVVCRPVKGEDGLKRYLSKGVRSEAAAWAEEKFGITRVDQGSVEGRRCQVSSSIGPAAREAYYARQTNIAA